MRFGRAPALALALALVSAACASRPATPAAPAPLPSEPAPAAPAPMPVPPSPAAPEPEPPASPPEPVGTAIKTATPPSLEPAREERAAIQAATVLASPRGLARARSLLASASLLRAAEVEARLWIVDELEAVLYGEGRAPARKPSSSLPSSAGEAAALARSIEDALAGRVDEDQIPSDGSGLAELIPALAVFVSTSNEIAQRAVESLARFDRLGFPSVVPDLARGTDAERRLEWGSARDRYRSALDRAPDTWPAAIGLGRAELALRRPVEALAVLEPLYAERSGSLAFLRPFADALYQNGRWDEASGLIARVLTDDPQNARFALMRAHILVRGRNYQQSIPLLDAYSTLDQTDSLYLLLRCLVAEGLRDRDEALRWARRGLSLHEDDAELLAAAARLSFAGPAGGREEGRAYAQRAFDLVEPGRGPADLGPAAAEARAEAGAEAARLLAADAAGRLDWAAARSYLERAMALAPFPDRALAALVLRRSGRSAESVEYSGAWYRERPDSEAAAEAYLRALADSGNERAASDLVAKLLPTRVSARFRSFMYYLQSRWQRSDDAALALLRSALVEYANNAEALASLCDIQIRRKDYAKARFYLKQALAAAPGDPDLLRRQRELEAMAGP